MNIDNFRSFLSKTFEGLNEPIEVQWQKSKSSWRGNFLIDDANYSIKAVNFSSKQKHFLFKFDVDGSYELKNDLKKAFSVIPTVEKAAIDFITEINPEAFIFCANDSSSGRKKFYGNFSRKIAKEFKMEYSTEKRQDFEMFILVNSKCDLVELSTFTIPEIFREAISGRI
jgi:hypothetical protein